MPPTAYPPAALAVAEVLPRHYRRHIQARIRRFSSAARRLGPGDWSPHALASFLVSCEDRTDETSRDGVAAGALIVEVAGGVEPEFARRIAVLVYAVAELCSPRQVTFNVLGVAVAAALWARGFAYAQTAELVSA